MPWSNGGLLEPDGGSSGSGTGTGGGSGPPGGGGGLGSFPPLLPAPGEGMFDGIGVDLGASSRTGVLGNQEVLSEIPGDLGRLYLNLNRFLLLAESRRKTPETNFYPLNHRFRGHRESHKFNLLLQKLITLCVSMYETLRNSNIDLKAIESSPYPSNTEVMEYYHITQQIRFKEWLLTKDEDKKWYI